MANPTSLARPPAGERFDPTAIDATGATLGHVLTAVSDGSGGQRAGYAATAAGYTDEQIFEASFITAMFAFFNRMADAYGLDYPMNGWMPSSSPKSAIAFSM